MPKSVPPSAKSRNASPWATNPVPGKRAPEGPLARIRFAPEQEKLAAVMAQFELERILMQFEQSDGMTAYRQHLLGTQVRFSETLSPRLFGLLNQVKQCIQFSARVELFVAADPMINAFAVHALDGGPHVVSLTSSLVERMNDEELRFVLGHELGHLAYEHYRAKLVYPALGVDDNGESKMPVLLRRRLGVWGRSAEISADRVGWAAAKGNLQAVVSAFFKMECGLGPEHVNFDISAFLGQLDELQKAGCGSTFCGFSHPLTPIRVRALQLFCDSGGVDGSPIEKQKADRAVSDLSHFMDYQVTGKLDASGRDLIIGGGLMVAHADEQEISREEATLLIDMLLPFVEDPEEELAKVQSLAQAEEMVGRSTSWLKENAGQEKFQMFGMLASIAAVDGVLKGKEEAVLLRVAEQLGIPESAARDMILNILSRHIQTKQVTGAPLNRLM